MVDASVYLARRSYAGYVTTGIGYKSRKQAGMEREDERRQARSQIPHSRQNERPTNPKNKPHLIAPLESDF